LVSIIFNLSTIIGASIFGKFYESSSNKNNYISLQYINVVMGIMMVAGMVVLIKMETYSFLSYTIVIVVEGFICGGMLNILTSN
jgi:hypothetical protein